MEYRLNKQRVAVVVTDGFQETEFRRPYESLIEAGAIPELISIHSGKVKSWIHGNWSREYYVDKVIDEVKYGSYDALVLPGGVMSPDKLRINKKVVEFVTGIFSEGKPVAAICHGPWTLIETGLLKGRTLTSYESIKTDLQNAGAHWVDQEVVVDNGLVTSRKPADLDAFCEKLIEEIAEGAHHIS